MRAISERISYLPATSNPLSSDVGLIHGDRAEWIFDVGSSEETADFINQINKKKIVVLSHFHRDHVENLGRVSYDELYCSKFTSRKLGVGTIATAPLTFEDGTKITIFPIPSPHSKGAIGLEVNEKFAFVGDALYGTNKDGKAAYNVSLLNETILLLQNIKAQKLLISHNISFVKDRITVIEELKKIYQSRCPNEPYLYYDLELDS